LPRWALALPFAVTMDVSLDEEFLITGRFKSVATGP
jgi:hypothetical protein